MEGYAKKKMGPMNGTQFTYKIAVLLSKETICLLSGCFISIFFNYMMSLTSIVIIHQIIVQHYDDFLDYLRFCGCI